MKRLILTVLGAVALIPLAAAGAQMRGSSMGGGRTSSGPARTGSFSHGPAFSRGPIGSAPSRGPMVSAPHAGPIVTARPTGARVFAPSGRFGTFPNRFNRFGRRAFFPRCFDGFPCRDRFFFSSSVFVGYPFGYSYPYYPYYPGDYYSPDPAYAAPAPVANTDNESNIELAREVQRLSDEVEDLRYEERRNSEPARPTPAPSRSGASLSAQTPAGSTTFVMRDGRHIVAQNYAIAGQTLWVVDEHRSRKFSLADIDRDATEKLNAENGIDLKLH